jgi:hypothetical protein
VTNNPNDSRLIRHAQRTTESYTSEPQDLESGPRPRNTTESESADLEERPKYDAAHITFAPVPRHDSSGKHVLYIPGPYERKNGE